MGLKWIKDIVCNSTVFFLELKYFYFMTKFLKSFSNDRVPKTGNFIIPRLHVFLAMMKTFVVLHRVGIVFNYFMQLKIITNDSSKYLVLFLKISLRRRIQWWMCFQIMFFF